MGGLQVTGGTIQNNVVSPITNSLTFNSQNAALTVAGSNPVTFSGPVVLGSGNNNLTIGNTGGTTISGVVSNFGTTATGTLTKAGSTTLTLTGGNIFTAPTVIQQGIINIQAPTALGVGGAGITVLSGATLQRKTYLA